MLLYNIYFTILCNPQLQPPFPSQAVIHSAVLAGGGGEVGYLSFFLTKKITIKTIWLATYLYLTFPVFFNDEILSLLGRSPQGIAARPPSQQGRRERDDAG